MGDRGYFVEPTVLTDTTPDMKVVREEIFGPVVVRDSVQVRGRRRHERGQRDELRPRVGDLDRAISTRRTGPSHRLRAGTVWINCYSVFDAAMPFGGYKESGWGREMGHNALENYLETKSVVTQLA